MFVSVFQIIKAHAINFMYAVLYTEELVYSGHPSEAAKWLLYTGGLLIEVFNVYVGTFRTDRLMQGDRPSQLTVYTGSTVYIYWSLHQYIAFLDCILI